jgi:6-phosphogluconolactonase
MNFLRALILPALLGQCLSAAEIPFYLGTFTDNTPSKGIYLGGIDSVTGKLGPVTLACAAVNPNFLAFAPNGKILYVAIRPAGKNAVGAYARRPDGTLVLLGQQPSSGDGMCHLWVDGSGRDVLTANYGSGNIACFPIKPDGTVGARTAFVQFTGTGPNPKRQFKPHAHSIYTDGDDRFVYACDLGTDSVWTFKFDPSHGTLEATDPPAAKVPPGSGARHLAFSPDGKIVYVANEMGHTVTVFQRDKKTGLLTAIQNIPTLTKDIPGDNVTTAEIFLHPSGRWLYVSNRGCDTIAVFAVGADGKLSFIQSVPAMVVFPRSFAIDPTGKWLISAGQNNNKIAVLKIDQTTGKLTATDQVADVGSPVCVLFPPQK